MSTTSPGLRLGAHTFCRRERPALIGMVHVLPTPSSPSWKGSMADLVDRAVADANALKAGGCDAIIVENMHDLPYERAAVHPATTAAMAVVTREVVQVGLPTGVQVLAGANMQALGVAVAAGASFVRAEAFAYAHVADEGFLQSTSAELCRMRTYLGADVQFFADVKKKHSAHALTSDLTLLDVAEGSAFCGADAVIVTGSSTGKPASLDDVTEVHDAGLPVLVGSGIDAASAKATGEVADGLIVGTHFKEDGNWRNAVDAQRVRAVRDALDAN